MGFAKREPGLDGFYTNVPNRLYFLPQVLRKRHPCKGASEQAELHFAFLADHRLVPRRLPGDADVGFAHAGDQEDFVFGVLRNRGAHATAGRGESDRDADFVAGGGGGGRIAAGGGSFRFEVFSWRCCAWGGGGCVGRGRGRHGGRPSSGFSSGRFFEFFDVHRIDQAEVDNVYRDFGIVDFFELIPDILGVRGAVFEGVGVNPMVGNGFADGIAVVGVDAIEAEISLHCETAAQRLVEINFRAGCKGVLVPTWDLRDGDVPTEDAFFGHGGGSGDGGGGESGLVF